MNEPARERPVDFFISYASQDRPFAERLYELLEARSNPYFDQRSLRSGLAWDDPLLTALKSAHVTVAIVSSYTAEAEYQKDEIALAVKRSRESSHRVVPVFLGQDIPDLFGLIRIEGITVTPATHVEEVAERLLRALENAPGEAEPAAEVHQPYEPLTRGVATARLQLDGFLNAYLGTPDHPEPLAGRQAELAKLDAWLAQDRAFALVTAPAGRGKSALLTRWAMNVAGRRAADVVFVPISLRHQTTRPADVLSLLGERLAWVVSGVEENSPPDTADDWRRRIARALTNVTPARRRPLLIVVDGADEMAGWQDTRLPLPMIPQPGVKVLVGARLLADRDAGGWRDWLNWRAEATVSFGLAPLDETSIAALVSDYLPALDASPAAEISRRLAELTGGDALTLRLYVGDLRERRNRGAEITADSLGEQVPGLAGYLQKWWAEQEQQWRADGHDPIEESADAEAILGLCAAAYGPLRESEISALVQGRAAGSLYLGRKLHELGRLLIKVETRAGSGSSLAHPRLAEHFADLQPVGRDQLITYCRRGREAIGLGAAPRKWNYVVHHYAAHLQADPELWEELQTLVVPAWREAWQALEGSDEGFLDDMGQAWASAGQILAGGPEAAAVGAQLRCAMASASIHGIAGAVPAQLMLALVREGVWSAEHAFDRARRVPSIPRRVSALAGLAPELTERDLRRGVQDLLTLQDAAEGLKGVPVLARHLPPGEARPILDEVMARSADVAEEWDRGVILTECAGGLAGVGDLAAAVRLARSSDLAWVRPVALVEALRAGGTASAEMFAEIEAGALELPRRYGYWAAWALAGLASLSPGDAVRLLKLAADRGRVLADPRQALRVVTGIAITAHRLGFSDVAREIWATAPALPEGVMGEVIAESNAKKWLTDWEGSEWGAEAELAASKPSPEREETLGRLTERALEVLGWRSRHSTLTAVAPWLRGMPAGTLRRVIDAFSEHANRFERGEGLAELSAALPREERPPVLRAALVPLEVVHDEYERSVALAALAEQMGETERRRWAATALKLARPLTGRDRAYGLIAVAAAADPGERPSLLGEALEARREAEDFLKADVVWATARAYARHGLINEAIETQALLGTDEELVKQLAAAASLDPGYLRAITVAAGVLPDPVRTETIAGPVTQLRATSRPDEALALARLLARRYGTGAVAAGLAPEIVSDLTDVAVEEAHQVRDVIRLVRTLPYLPAAELPPARQRVLELLGDPQNSNDQEGSLSQFISEQLAAEIANFAETISDPRYRGRLLRSVLPGLHGPERTRAIQVAWAALETVEPDFVRAGDAGQLAGAIGDEIAFGNLQSVTAAVCDLDYTREEPLRAVTSVAQRLSRPRLTEWWNAALPRLARRPRETLLGDIVILAPVIARLAGEPGLIRAAEAIEDASNWFRAQPA